MADGVPRIIANCQLPIFDFPVSGLLEYRSKNWQSAITKIGNDLRRDQRLQLQGMEGEFLSHKHFIERHALVLRRAFAGGGTQQHFLSLTATEHRGKLEGAGT